MSRFLLPFILFLFLLAGCGDRPSDIPRAAVHDLIANLDLAKVRREPGLVDLGTPEARAMLGRGWSNDETSGNRTYVWSDGPESEIEFFLTVPRDVPLILQGDAYRAATAPLQEVDLVLNGEAVGSITVEARGGESRVVLPERHLREGTNRLVLRYAWTRSPAEETGERDGDRRRLAVAWDLLRFATGVDEQGRVRAAGDLLAIPFGWRLDAYLRLPSGAALAMDGLRSRGGQPGELLVTVQPEEGEEREVARLPPQGPQDEPATVELENEEEGLLRLSLIAVPGEPGGPVGSGLVLRRPVIAAPASGRGGSGMGSTRPAVSHPRNVIIYLVDTLRADHLGCYGYERPVSPRIDAFAREATLFRHTVAQSSWTRPAVATILTGLLPVTHGVQRRRSALSPKAVTLAEMLKERGYRTAGVITNGNVARSFGFAQGFDTYRLLPHPGNAATDVNDHVAEWLDAQEKSDAPFFLYLHTVEPHAPYGPPPSFRQRFAPGAQDDALTRMRVLRLLQRGKIQPTPQLLRNLLDLYDAEIAANDAAFGELMDLLVRRGLWEETVVVFVSDHGEEFLEHGGWEHGKTLYTEMLDVPMILRIPGMGEGKVVERQAQHLDIVPTVLSALGLPVPSTVEGRSLLSWIAGAGTPESTHADEAAFSWLDRDADRAAAVTTPAWRLIETRSPRPGHSLYDRRADPGERKNLATDRSVRTGYFGARLRAEERPRKGALRAGEGVIDPELRKQLQALGYVH